MVNKVFNWIRKKILWKRTWVALSIGTSVVEFTTGITCWDVDLCKVANSSDLNVFWSFDKVDALEGFIWEDTGSAS